MSEPVIMRVMALSISVVRRAGVIIREVMEKGDLGIVDKGKDDLQTEADRSAQQCIIASLNEVFPSLKVIGEEGCSDLNVKKDWLVTEMDVEFLKNPCPLEWRSVNVNDMVVWVDPLDGTSEYTQGFLDHVTVLVGVAIKGSAVGGIIHQPYYQSHAGEVGRTIWGLKCLGAGGFKAQPIHSDKFIVTTTRSHFSATVKAALDALSPNEIIRVGGAGYKVLQLLEGKAHAYVFASAGCKKWDTCAPEAVLEAQGGTLTDVLGEHYCYNSSVEHSNKYGVLATIKSISHKDIVKKLSPLMYEIMSGDKP